MNMKKIFIPIALVMVLLLSACGSNNVNTKISEEKAKEIALEKVPGATTQDIRQFKKDRDDGRYVYEGEILYNKTEYDFEIDAESGEIISWDQESEKLFD